MNLKEAFRYQKFLDSMMANASYSIQNRDHSMKITRTHFRHKANQEAEDMTEIVEVSDPFFPNDDVIRFMQHLIEEKEKLSVAIGRAKAASDFDIDAAIEVNKLSRDMLHAIKQMLRFKAYRKMDQGRDFKFDTNGVQSPYFYDMEITAEEAFSRKDARNAAQQAIEHADAVSSRIDAALINLTVDYAPPYNVNDSFDDAMEAFLTKSVS